MRKTRSLAVLAAAVLVTAGARGATTPRPFTFATLGDVPYGTSPTDTSQAVAFPSFIDSINADADVSLVLHVGDLHSGKQFCTEAYDRQVFDMLSDLQDPLVYTPGDNEWADCHKTAEGGGSYDAATGQIKYILDAGGEPVDFAGGNPLANLALVRSIYFPRPGVTLGERVKVLSQAHVASHRKSDRQYVENVLWQQSGVVFVAINLPGGSNNDTDVWYGAPTASAAQKRDTAERTGADLRWLDRAFDLASSENAEALVILTQADMWDPEKGAAHQTGYEPIVKSIATLTTHFHRPVLLFNGDSHVFRSDNPLAAADPLNYMHPGYDVPNFHRIVVHGSTTPLEWLKVTVTPGEDATTENSFGPFSWERMPLP